MRARSHPVAVVTDSTASLPPQGAHRSGLHVVPLHVIVDGRSHLEGVDISTDQIIAALRAGHAVSTSQPAPEAFMEVYARAAAAGAKEIVSVHIADELSGTLQAARVAAATAPVPVHLVDSRAAGMVVGLAARVAANRAGAGATGHECAEAARRVGATGSVMFTVATLEFLRRGGRLSAAQAAVGTALGLRPVLRVRDGAIEVVERVRTVVRARERLTALVRADVATRHRVELAVHHLESPVEAQRLATELRTSLAERVVAVQRSEISALM